MNQVKTKKLGFRNFWRFVTRALTLDREIGISTFFEHCLVFATFKRLPVGLES